MITYANNSAVIPMKMDMKDPKVRAVVKDGFIKAWATREYLEKERDGNVRDAEAIKSAFNLTDADIERGRDAGLLRE